MLRLESSPIPLLWLKEHYVHKMQVHTTYNNTSYIIHIYIYIYLIYIVVYNLYALLISFTLYNTSMHYHVMCCWLSAFSCGNLASITQPTTNQWWFLVKKLQMNLVDDSVSRLKFMDEKKTCFTSGTFEGSIIWVENFGKWRSPSTFTRVSTHHLFLCGMFLASDALLGSTLDSKGLGGLWKQQTADEETSAPKVSLDDIDWSNTYNL